jgi:hypothetical protein
LDESGSDILWKSPGQLWIMDKQTHKWDDRGKGVISVRKPKCIEGPTKTPYIVFTTESGRYWTVKSIDAVARNAIAVINCNLIDCLAFCRIFLNANIWKGTRALIELCVLTSVDFCTCLRPIETFF